MQTSRPQIASTRLFRSRSRALIAVLAAGLGVASAGTLRTEVEQAAQRNFAEYLELLRQPNVPEIPADIVRNAELLQSAFAKRGFRVRLVDNAAGRQAVLAELSSGGSGRPTLRSNGWVPHARATSSVS